MAAHARAGSLPRPISSFIGREHVLADTARLLGDHRLLTLTVPGGSGAVLPALRLPAAQRRLAGCMAQTSVSDANGPLTRPGRVRGLPRPATGCRT